VLLRVNPAVAASTHAAMDTGAAGSKFGVALADAPALIDEIRAVDGLELDGLHAHIGSQLLELDEIRRAAEALAALGPFDTYDLGGGLGIAYRPGDRAPSIAQYADVVVGALHEHLGGAGARLIVEPGRSLVGRSALTLYSVITVKHGARTHVAVDGGMGDNLEPMLYGATFAPVVVDADRPAQRCELVGRHCESGDVLAAGVALASPRVGDLVAVPCTGAYCYALLNNYNGALRPPVLLCRDGDARVAVRRERLDELLARDVVPILEERAA
jgi:diaminopimelate decarboxylase